MKIVLTRSLPIMIGQLLKKLTDRDQISSTFGGNNDIKFGGSSQDHGTENTQKDESSEGRILAFRKSSMR